MSVRKEELTTMEAILGATSESSDSAEPPKNNTERTFRDGVRKIDFILVVKDEENIMSDTLKYNFLTNIVKTGFEIEFENGVLPIHRKLVFFKIHCPNDVLNNLGKAFGVKCVQSARSEYIMSHKEREWINLIRKEYTQPLQYSSLERSLVVYMALLNVPFGDRQNYIGLKRLMKRNIVVDAYALHDGPYYIPQDASRINARQILFYNWAGMTNIFTRQPLTLVHEYFGLKVALYFAYYGLYNIFLAIASMVALLTFFLAIYSNDYMDLRRPVCDNKYNPICFKCVATSAQSLLCQAYYVHDFCKWYTMTVIFDNKYTPYFATFILLWGMIFSAYSFGNEKYLNWIWETHNKDYNSKQIRPDFQVLEKTNKSNKTGIVVVKHRESKIKILLCYIGIILLDVLVFAVFTHRKTLLQIMPDRIMSVTIVVTIELIIALYVIDLIHRKVASYIVRLENHKSYMSYSRSLAKHIYVMCFSLPMIVLGYYAFQMAVFEFLLWRGYKYKYEYLFDDTCAMTSCSNNLSIAFTIILLLRFGILRKLSLYSSVTDYNQREIVENVPCWEREFVLPRLNENILANKMATLATQFILIIAFGFSCPPAILIVLLFNIYHVRRDATLFTLHYKRPMFLNNNAFSVWSEILKLMVYLAIVVNVVSLVCSTDFIEAYIRERRMPPINSLADYLGVFFINFKVNLGECYARAYIYVAKSGAPYTAKDLTADELKTSQYMYIFTFEIIMAAIYLIVQFIFSIDVDEKEIPKKRVIENYDE
ncbi:PREDICTED: anoctamin-9-like isoform X3 [Papilio polytes]|uniref:anoctamin-9-like isoform X3 n=1 Tax=Papilio polytes TaxID=76194 RepID=UPI000676B0B1|nr:PREDICTED: anoctamin-9-like isoform X3 [Papilio polytes]